jgi:hypothetical protein
MPLFPSERIPAMIGYPPLVQEYHQNNQRRSGSGRMLMTSTGPIYFQSVSIVTITPV